MLIPLLLLLLPLLPGRSGEGAEVEVICPAAGEAAIDSLVDAMTALLLSSAADADAWPKCCPLAASMPMSP